jgi:hypothetical protein
VCGRWGRRCADERKIDEKKERIVNERMNNDRKKGSRRVAAIAEVVNEEREAKSESISRVR